LVIESNEDSPWQDRGQGISAVVDQKLRILELVNVRWWNACAEYGINLAKGLHQRGHRVIVMGREGSPPLERAQQAGIPVQATQMESHRPGQMLGSLRSLIELIRRENIQVINAHRAEGHLFAALASSLLVRRPVVIRTRGDVRPPKTHLLNRYLHRRLTDGLILAAEVLREPVLKSLGRPPRALMVIPPGINLEPLAPGESPEQNRRELGLPEGNGVVGMVGRLSPVKGHGFFLEAARIVLRERPGTTFVVVGHEAQIKMAQLQEQADRLGLADRLYLAGYVPEVSRWMEALDIAVVASIGSEVICRVALEHMAMAKPVVGTRVNAIPEVVEHGSTGLLVPPGDPQAMAQAILALLRDPQKARAFGLAGRKRVEQQFTLDHLAGRTERLYRDLLEGGR
jgi:glycosyltransferase involved in cell wall biosynthesis